MYTSHHSNLFVSWINFKVSYILFSSSETEGLISGADGITDLSVVHRRPSIRQLLLKSLPLLQFIFYHSEFFTGETRHIVSPCNKAGISNFRLEFQISLKRYSSFSSYLIILIFFTRETWHIVPPCNKAGISNFCLEFQI